MEIYQDIYSKGELSREGVRECASRYKKIKGSLSKYNRNFSILDIGANFGYFSIRAAEDFGCTSIMVQSEPESSLLQNLCHENPDLNLSLINKRISCKEIVELSKCERFDTIFLLNVLHHLGPDWRSAAEACLKMAEHVIIETPSDEDEGACGKEYLKDIIDFIKNNNHKILGEFPRHTDPNNKSIMAEIDCKPEKFLEKTYIDLPEFMHARMGKLEVFSNSSFKKFIKNGKGRDYISGMNLHNFLKLNGSWPTKGMIASKLEGRDIFTTYAWDDTHRDITPWNFILNGSTLHLIDTDGGNPRFPNDDAGLNWTINSIKDKSGYNPQ